LFFFLIFKIGVDCVKIGMARRKGEKAFRVILLYSEGFFVGRRYIWKIY